MIILTILGVIIIGWTIATYFVEQTGPEKKWSYGENRFDKTALIVFDPDPIYNLDEQVAKSFAKGLIEDKWQVTVTTIAGIENSEIQDFDLYVFCANTYNFKPDKAVTSHILNHETLKGKKAVAITLGSGATKRSQRIHEQNIISKDAELLGSKAFWLIRPNDENQRTTSNIIVANEIAKEYAITIAKKFEMIMQH